MGSYYSRLPCFERDDRCEALRAYDYDPTDDVLGEGQFGTVYKAHNHTTNIDVALKVMSRSSVAEHRMESALKEEVEILLMIEHPHVIRAYEFFEDADNYYLSTELLSGGELFDRIVDIRRYSECNARDLVRVLLSTVSYLHDMDIVHRDIKPENLLLVSAGDDTQVKLADFGFAERLQQKKSRMACGTPGYIGPEILRGEPYGVEVDVFSLGVVLYILLSGRPPFYDSNTRKRMKKNRDVVYSFERKSWREVSESAKELIAMMMERDPAQRITARQALQHPWVLESSQELERRPIPGAMTELRRFNLKRKFRAIVRAAVLSGKLIRMVEALAAEFESDPNIRSMHEKHYAESMAKAAREEGDCGDLADETKPPLKPASLPAAPAGATAHPVPAS